MDVYIRKVLRVSVAQICQTIGYNSIQTIPLELLIDSLHKFLQEFARDLHRHVELFNRTEPNLDDVALSLQSLNIGVNDLLEYINHVQPVACCIEIPELPALKQSNLNFLKPGSKEVLTRPVHIYEHLPPILRDSCEPEEKSSQVSSLETPPVSNASNTTNHATNIEIAEELVTKTNGTLVPDTNENADPNVLASDNLTASTLVEAKKRPGLDATVTPPPGAVPSSATREISSVMMTSGGFISPAIEGRMPECNIPDIVDKYFGLDAPPAPPSVPANLAQTSVHSGKSATGSSLQSNVNPGSLRGLVKNDDSVNSSSGNKLYQTVDKKLLKKVKKKSLMPMGPPNVSGVIPATPNDKAQRKRIKMLQKSMAKNSSNGTSGVFKTKSGTAFVPGQQEKFRKKQYKLRQKQMQQHVQKPMDDVEVPIPTTSPQTGSNRPHALQSAGHGGSKMKKDYFVVPPQIADEPSPDMPHSKSFLTPVPFHPFKGNMYIEANVSSQDVGSVAPSQQTLLHGPPSPKYEEVKLSNEPDRSKLNIFKKISSSRKERTDTAVTAASAQAATSSASNQNQSTGDASAVATSSNTTIFSNDQVISLPSGTTITPAPPSGSGRHVYAPPPSTQSGDFDSVVQVDDDGSIPEGSAVLMKRGDLMIHKPKKRGRKPGSKNQPKILGFPTKKTKKLKKTLFGSHPNANLIEPLNLSHSSIANIANIPLGIASTFPLDSEAAIKLKKDRKKAKLGKDPNFVRGAGKSGSARNLAPTKEEFASINQKLMMMDTVLQAAPPFPSNINAVSTSKVARSNSPALEASSQFPIEPEPKMKKERKKAKQSKDQKLLAQHSSQSLSSGLPGSSKTSPNLGSSRKSPQPYTPNFPNVPGMGGLPMFSFFPYTARPGLIPSHNIFSQIPNMPNSGLFMPPLMGFPPLNPPIRSFLKDEKEPTPPLLQAGEGNYSKVAPLVPDTMKLDFSPPSRTATSSPGLSGSKAKNPSNTSTTTKAGRSTPTGPSFTSETSVGSAQMNAIGHFGDSRKKVDEHNSSVVSSSSGNTSTSLRQIDVTIEVSSDDSNHEGISGNKSKFSSRTTTITSTTVSSTSSSFHRLSHKSADFSASDSVNIVNDSDASAAERRNKEHKKLKKLGKQGKKHATLSGTMEVKNPSKSDSTGGVTGGFDEELSPMLMNTIPESGKKSEEMANSSSHTAYDYQVSPERRKDHKKMKKLLKEGKLKKKKDKKDKNKNKDRSEKLIKGDKSEKRKEEKKDKDKLKKLKKEKKKDKQRSDIDVATIKYTSSGEGTGSATEVSSVVPKLTLKLGQSSQSPIQVEGNEIRKSGQKSGHAAISHTGGGKPGGSIIGTSSGREPSPELARISPLVTRPPKQKSGTDDSVSSNSVISPVGNSSSSTGQPSSGSHQTPSLSASLNIAVDSVIDVDSNSGGPTTSTLPASATILGLGINPSSNNTPGTSAMTSSTIVNNTISAAMHATSTPHNQHQTSHQNISSNKHSTTVPLLSETNRPSSYIDAEGNRVWICPACGKVDDGSAMIGCDGCDAWYHWVCVGILVAPNDNEDWYCRVCITKKRGAHSGDRKRKRNKKKNLNS